MDDLQFQQLSAQIADLLARVNNIPQAPQKSALDEYIPVGDIFAKKIIGRTAFYEQVSKGVIKTYKLANKTFVRADEFSSAFRLVNI